MGKAACQIIINEGNVSYAIVQDLAKRFPEVNTHFLSAAINATCQGTLHASLYMVARKEYDRFSPEYTQPIIDLHQRINLELPRFATMRLTIRDMQIRVDNLTNELMTAIRNTEELFDK